MCVCVFPLNIQPSSGLGSVNSILQVKKLKQKGVEPESHSSVNGWASIPRAVST